uniref:CCHC-type domain-containing protein n=1 Tax=Ditylenchus dipsaci TaxID=166011 RepID=A0A915EGQ7_9BILA
MFGKNRQCWVCRKIGHIASECPVNNMHQLSPVYSPTSNRLCFMCGYRGHIADTCPANVVLKLGVTSGHCYVCCEKGHTKKNCPERYKWPLKGPWREQVDIIRRSQGYGGVTSHCYWLEIDDESPGDAATDSTLTCRKKHIGYHFSHLDTGGWKETDLLDPDRRRKVEESYKNCEEEDRRFSSVANMPEKEIVKTGPGEKDASSWTIPIFKEKESKGSASDAEAKQGEKDGAFSTTIEGEG